MDSAKKLARTRHDDDEGDGGGGGRGETRGGGDTEEREYKGEGGRKHGRVNFNCPVGYIINDIADGGKIVSSSAPQHPPTVPPRFFPRWDDFWGPVSMAVQSYFQRCIHLGSRHFKLFRHSADLLSPGLNPGEGEGWRRNRLPIGGLSSPLFSTCEINFDRSIRETLKGYCNKFVPDPLKSIHLAIRVL